jgi:hypothetical protein
MIAPRRFRATKRAERQLARITQTLRGVIMERDTARVVVSGDALSATIISRRYMAAGLGLLGSLLAAPQLVSSGTAQARELRAPEAAAGPAPEAATRAAKVAKAGTPTPTDTDEVTDLSAQRWRRRPWRRRRRWRRRWW